MSLAEPTLFTEAVSRRCARDAVKILGPSIDAAAPRDDQRAATAAANANDRRRASDGRVREALRPLRREPALPRPGCRRVLPLRVRRLRVAAAGRRVPLRPAQGDEAEVGAVLPAPRLWRRARQPHAAVGGGALPGRRAAGARRVRRPVRAAFAPPPAHFLRAADRSLLPTGCARSSLARCRWDPRGW